MINSSEITQLILDTFPEENTDSTYEINMIDRKINKLHTRLKELKDQCSHPKRYVRVINDGHYIPDGYGGDNYSGDKYRATCTLCGIYNAGTLVPEDLDKGYKNSTTGTPKLVTRYEELVLKKKQESATFYKEREEALEKAQLAKLKAKYE